GRLDSSSVGTRREVIRRARPTAHRVAWRPSSPRPLRTPTGPGCPARGAATRRGVRSRGLPQAGNIVRGTRTPWQRHARPPLYTIPRLRRRPLRPWGRRGGWRPVRPGNLPRPPARPDTGGGRGGSHRRARSPVARALRDGPLRSPGQGLPFVLRRHRVHAPPRGALPSARRRRSGAAPSRSSPSAPRYRPPAPPPARSELSLTARARRPRARTPPRQRRTLRGVAGDSSSRSRRDSEPGELPPVRAPFPPQSRGLTQGLRPSVLSGRNGRVRPGAGVASTTRRCERSEPPCRLHARPPCAKTPYGTRVHDPSAACAEPVPCKKATSARSRRTTVFAQIDAVARSSHGYCILTGHSLPRGWISCRPRLV